VGVLPPDTGMSANFSIQMAGDGPGEPFEDTGGGQPTPTVEMLLEVSAANAGQTQSGMAVSRQRLNVDTITTWYSTDYPSGGTEVVDHGPGVASNNDEIALSDPIMPDNQAMRSIEQAWEAFDAMPLPDGPVQADENIDLLRTLEEYATLKRQIEAMEEDLDAIKARVLAFKAPDRGVTCRGYSIEYRAPATKTDYRKACRDNHIDLTAYQTKGEPVWAIKLAPPIFEPDDE